MPHRSCPAWIAIDTANPEDPTLGGGVLTLATSDLVEQMGYDQSVPAFSAQDPFEIEVRTRYVTGTHDHADYTHIQIGAGMGANLGNALFVGHGEIFLWEAADETRGPTAYMDTTVFHTYRMTLDASGTVKVFVDGSALPILEGQTYADPDWGPSRRMGWGDHTLRASGVSEWEFVRTNQWADRSDSDADGVLDRCDRDDGLIYVFFEVPDIVTWQEEVGFDHWNLYKGDIDVLRSSRIYTQVPGSNALADRFCGLVEPSQADPVAPPVGKVAFFLPTGVSGGVESSLGVDSQGVERPNTNPCP